MNAHAAEQPQITPSGPKPTSWTEWVGYISAGLFSCLVIYVIAFTTLDEAVARFGAVGVSAFIVTLIQPAVKTRLLKRAPRLGWVFDAVLLVGIAWSAWWFFQVKAQLWTGFYTATPMNIAAGLTGLVVVLILTHRAWGWPLVLLALGFSAFGFAGPYLPSFLTHFGVNIRDFMQIVWYSFDGVFGRTTGLVADNLLIFLIFGAVLERTGAGESLIHISTALMGRIRGGPPMPPSLPAQCLV